MTAKTAFVVEDNKDIAELYRTSLSMIGYEAECVHDGKEALDRLETVTPDLIILDMNLPHVSGHYLYQKIRATSHLDDVPVIISTANMIAAETLSGNLGKHDRLLVKPISPRQLHELIAKLTS
jgi:DNA-binding response OmpR family regulator